MKRLKQTVLRLPHSPSWPLVLFEVSPSWQQSPLYVIYLTHQNVLDCKVQLVKFNPANLPSPLIGTYANTRIHTCMYTTSHAQKTPFPFYSHSPLLFQNISSFHAATYASWMFASDIQISSAAKCANAGLSWPILGGRTSMSGRQLRDKTTPLLLMRTFFTSLRKVNMPSEC